MTNPNYDTDLLTTTFEKFLNRQAADAVFNELPLFEYLNGRGKVKRKADGGRKLLTPIMYAGNSTVQSYSGYDRLDISPQEGFTNAEYDWKQYSGAVSISGSEEEQNAGETQMLNLLDSKWMQLRISFRDELNTDAFADGTGNGGKDMVGLSLMVDSAGTYGNIARGSNSWWAAQETATGGPLTVDGSAGMRRMYNDCSLGKGSMLPDFLLTTQEIFEEYESLMAPYIRYGVSGEANASFKADNLKFRRSMMTWDHECQSGVLYFLNSQVVEFVIKEGRDFKVTPFQTPIDQDAKVAKILWMGALAANNCRHLGKLTGITT